MTTDVTKLLKGYTTVRAMLSNAIDDCLRLKQSVNRCKGSSDELMWQNELIAAKADARFFAREVKEIAAQLNQKGVKV